MKKLVLTLCAVFVTAALVRAEDAAPAVQEPAPSKDWSIEVGGDFYSEYIFRGVEISADEPMYSPHLIASWKGFATSFYGYYSDVPGLDWYTEHNYTLDYTATLGKLSLTGGALYYHYPEGASGIDTWELYAIVGYDFPLLNPVLSYYHDVDEFEDAGYLSLGISHDFDLTKTVGLKEPMALTVTPSAKLSVDINNWSKATSSNIDWNDLLLGLSTSLALNETVSIHAGVQLSVALGSLEDAGQGDELIGNVGFAFAF